jgi:hypothetical protein
MSHAATVRLATAIAVFLPMLSLAEDFTVSGLTFSPPPAWTSEDPPSQMRKAQFAVGKGEEQAEVVFFYFGPGGAGGVEANIQRWFAQFKEPRDQIGARTEKAKAGEVPVTFVSAKGTYLSGSPRGPKMEKPGYAMLAAIVEAKDGAIFAKLTGPAATVDAAGAEFRKMIGGAK